MITRAGVIVIASQQVSMWYKIRVSSSFPATVPIDPPCNEYTLCHTILCVRFYLGTVKVC